MSASWFAKRSSGLSQCVRSNSALVLNTPAHLLLGGAAFGNPGKRGTLPAAFLGAFAPDVSLYLMVSVSIWVLGIPAEQVFREYYYSDAWQAVFAVDNSFILWGAALGLAMWLKSPIAVAFTGAAMLHLALDFPLHTHDARQHFWPISDWVFESPVSYWDSRAHAGIVGPVALSMSAGAVILIWRRVKSIWIRAFTGALFLMELASSGIWRLVF